MDQEKFKQITSDVLKRHYEDRMHYSAQPGDIANDIKNGIRMVVDVLDSISVEGNEKDVLMETARKLTEQYNEYRSIPEVKSDKWDKFGFTCAVLSRCAEDFKEIASKIK